MRRILRDLFKKIFLLCLCVFTVLAASILAQPVTAEQESFKVQKVESSFFSKLKNNLSKLLGPDEDNEIPPTKKVTWVDLYDLDPETHQPSSLLQSRINSEISIKGFFIPLEFDEQRKVTEFLLVPYIPSCMHVPPPPPSQIIHVKLNEGKMIENPFLPIEVVGHLKVSEGKYFEDQMTTSYKMEVRSLEVLKDSDMDPTIDFFESVLQ
jgi:hypothetical protein